MDNFINFELLSNPVNWAIIALMLAIGTFALHLILAQTPSQGLTG